MSVPSLPSRRRFYDPPHAPRGPDSDTREMRALLTEVRNRHGRHFSALETQRIDALLQVGAKRKERGI